MTVADAVRGERRSARAILPGTSDAIDTFFDYGRAQIYVACQWAAEVRAMIAAVEAAGVFEREADWVVKMTSGVAANDILRWTALGGGAYKLEWWQVQLDGSSYQKYMQMELSHFSRTGDVITARGKVSAHPSSDPTAIPWTHYARAGMGDDRIRFGQGIRSRQEMDEDLRFRLPAR